MARLSTNESLNSFSPNMPAAEAIRNIALMFEKSYKSLEKAGYPPSFVSEIGLCWIVKTAVHNNGLDPTRSYTQFIFDKAQ